MHTLGINTTADNFNRLSAKSDGILFSHDDQTPGSGDVTLALNRADDHKSARLLFQENYSTRVEIGLIENSDFLIKILNKNSEFIEVQRIDADSGVNIFPHGLTEPRRYENDGILDAGGSDWWGPADPMVANHDTTTTFNFANGRLNFTAIFIPRPSNS